MKIIAVVNNKGGVGKTTVSRILTEYFAMVKKEKILAIDMDPQANFSNRFINMEIDPYEPEGKMPPLHPDFNSEDLDDDWDGRSSIASIFFGEAVYPYPTYLNNLEILPAHSSRLLIAEQIKIDEVVERVYDQLNKFLSLKEVQELYTKIIIDTPPAKGPLTRSVLRAANHIVIPSTMEPKPIEGIYGMIHLWKAESLRRSNDNPLNLIGVLPNSIDSRSTLHKDLLDNLKNEIPDHVLESKLARRLIYAEVDAKDSIPPSIFDYPDSHVAKIEVMKLCEEIEQKMENGHV